MTNSIFPILLIGLVCLIAGFLIGMAFSGRGASPAHTGTGKGQPAKVQSDPGVVEAVKKTPALEPASPPPSSAPPLMPVYTPPPMEAIRKPNANPIDFFARALTADVPKANAEPKSIAGQIDEILQEKLTESPLANRAIRLMELPGKGMVVMVGLNQYDGVEAVPDAEVRAMIRSAVAEWERRVDEADT